MKKYEIILILNDQKVDNAEGFASSFSEQVSKLGGSLETSKVMGRKSFARAIGKKTAGTFINAEIQLPSDKVGALHDAYRLDDSLLRIEVYVFDRPEITQSKPKPEAAAS